MKTKNKKAEQFADRQKHKEQLRAKRRTEPNLERAVAKLPENPSILIVCEGKNTEPSYFNQFRVLSATVKSVGTGYNTISLVNKTIRFASQEKYDQVWCVFDADPKPDNPNQAQNFNEAIKLAEKHNFLCR